MQGNVKDETSRRKFTAKLEKEEFKPFPDLFYKTSSKVPKKVHKGDVEDEEYHELY